MNEEKKSKQDRVENISLNASECEWESEMFDIPESQVESIDQLLDKYSDITNEPSLPITDTVDKGALHAVPNNDGDNHAAAIIDLSLVVFVNIEPEKDKVEVLAEKEQEIEIMMIDWVDDKNRLFNVRCKFKWQCKTIIHKI